MLRSITVLGSSSGRNAGDAALIAGLMASIDRCVGRRLLYEIPTLRPEFIWHSYENRVRPVGMAPWYGALGMIGIPTLQSVLRTDATIIYDNMLFDKKLFNPFWNYMLATRGLVPIAKRAGKILGCYNIGAGPVTTERGRRILRDIGNLMDFITVRDTESLDLLREIGVTNKNIVVTADAALSVAPAPAERVNQIMRELGLENDREILAINVNHYVNTWTGIAGEGSQRVFSQEEFAREHAAGVSRAAKELGVPVVFVVTQHRDIPITTTVQGLLDPSVRSVIFSNVKYGHHDIKGVLGRMSLLFAMRLHSLILGTSALTPAVPLVFQQKVIGYFRRLGLEQYLMPFSEFSADGVYRAIINGWADRESIRAKLNERVPSLIKEADKAAEIIAGLSRGLSVEQAIRDATANARTDARLEVVHG